MYNYTLLNPDTCEFIPICMVDELPSGERMFVDVDENSVVLFNIDGEIFAIADICSHDDGPLGEGDLEGFDICCPRHGARFDVRTGEVLSLPAVVDIPAYPIRVVDNQIEIGFPINL